MAEINGPVYPQSDLSYYRGQLLFENGSLKAPETIFPSAAAARNVYYRCRGDSLMRIDLFASIEGLVEGNPPYDPVELARNKLEHIANFNNFEAGGLCDRQAQAYFNLSNEVDCLIKIQMTNKSAEAVQAADVIAKHWSDVVQTWPAFYTNENINILQIVKFGLSPIIWSDERDWRYRVIDTSKFYVENQALTDMDQLTYVFVETTLTVQHLFEIYEEMKKKGDKQSLWNVEALERLLVWCANTWTKPKADYLDMMDLQRRYQDNDSFYNWFFTDSVPLIALVAKEYSGKYSYYIFDKFINVNDYLFKSIDQYKCLEEAFQLYTSSPGVKTIYSNRGLGHKIFAACQATNMFDCSIVDMGRWAATPLVQSSQVGGPTDGDKLRVTPGVPVYLGNLEFVQNNLGSNMVPVSQAAQYISGKLAYNLSNSGDDPSSINKSEGSQSAPEYRARSFKEFNLSKNCAYHYYKQKDKTYQTMFIKMLHAKEKDPGYEYVEEWKRRCKEDGIPEELFSVKNSNYWGLPYQYRNVYASRAAGDGSVYSQILGLETLGPVVPSFSARGQNAYQRRLVKATLGEEYVNEFVQDPVDANAESQGASVAGLENNAMAMGMPAVFSIDNDHRAHIATHFAKANELIQMRSQQQMSAADADKVFALLVPHTGEHIQAIANNPFTEQFFEGIRKPWKQIQDYANFNRRNAQNELQAELKKREQLAQKQEEAMSDAQRKDFQAQSDEARKDRKLEAQLERTDEANRTRAQIERDSSIRKSENERLKIELDAKNKARENQETVPPEDQSTDELRDNIRDLAGSTPSPIDIEGVPRVR